jgi:Protein of unknown function (DUF4058)
MASPFPGMDPYLEHPEVWPGVHLLLIAALSESLAPQLRPNYTVSVEVRMYETTDEQSLLVGIPDVVVREKQGFLEVREVATKAVVTAIELLSPVNKRAGTGRQTYETKRQKVLGSATHLVEIDLLRAYKPMPLYGNTLKSNYSVLVSRSHLRPEAELYAFNLSDKLPTFHLPLREGDVEPTVNLQQLLNDIYDRSAYDLKLDYTQPLIPPLTEKDDAWLHNILKEKGFR